MRIFLLPQRLSDAIDNANRSINEVRLSVTSVLLPLKVLLWVCISIVAIDICRGHRAHDSLAYRTIVGAIDQLWYAIFYFSIPFLWKRCTEAAMQISTRREWVVVHDKSAKSGSVDTITERDVLDDTEWVIVEYDG